MSDYPVRDGAGNVIIGAGGDAPRFTFDDFRGPAGQSVLNTDLLTGVVNGWLDVSAFEEMSLTIAASAGISAGAVTIEGTNDVVLHSAGLPVQGLAELFSYNFPAPVIITAASTTRTFRIPVQTKFMRARISTGIVGGTVQAFASCGSARAAAFTAIMGIGGHSSAIAGSPVRIGAKSITTPNAVVSNGATTDLVATPQGVLITRPWQIPEHEWAYAAAAGGVINTTDVPLKAAAGVNLRNYITGMTLKNVNAVAGEVVLKDGAAIIWRGHLSASMVASEPITFPSPMRTTSNTALNFACLTTGQQVYVNAQGYVAP